MSQLISSCPCERLIELPLAEDDYLAVLGYQMVIVRFQCVRCGFIYVKTIRRYYGIEYTGVLAPTVRSFDYVAQFDDFAWTVENERKQESAYTSRQPKPFYMTDKAREWIELRRQAIARYNKARRERKRAERERARQSTSISA